MTERINGLPNTPDEAADMAELYDDMFAVPEQPLPERRWTAEAVAAYRAALARIPGWSADDVERQVVKDCGAEFSTTAMLSVPQAGGVR